MSGRHAHFVVACTVLKIALDVVSLARELVFLHECHTVLKVTEVHSEHVVILVDLVSPVPKLAFGFRPVSSLGRDCGRNGAVGRQFGGIDVPSGVYLAAERYLYNVLSHLFLAHAEVYGVLHLRARGHGKQREKQCDEYLFLHNRLLLGGVLG